MACQLQLANFIHILLPKERKTKARPSLSNEEMRTDCCCVLCKSDRGSSSSYKKSESSDFIGVLDKSVSTKTKFLILNLLIPFQPCIITVAKGLVKYGGKRILSITKIMTQQPLEI